MSAVAEPNDEIASQVKTMRAAILRAPGIVEVEEVHRPEPRAGEVLVRLEGCGVCASNLPPWEGRPWFSYPMGAGDLGHEGWGVIQALGAGVSPALLGRRVAMLSYHAYAEYDVAQASALAPLPAVVDEFPGEPLGCAVNIFTRSGVKAGDTVAIVGIGFLGALLVEMAARAGARVIAIARRAFAQEAARARGAAHVLTMDNHDRIIQQVKELTDGRFCDVVIEATGKQWPLDLSGELTRERGRMVIAGYHQDGPRQVNLQLWNWRGFDVINAHERDSAVYLAGMREAARRVSAGTLHPAALYTHRFPLERLGDALRMTAERPEGFMKALIRF